MYIMISDKSQVFKGLAIIGHDVSVIWFVHR